MTLDEATKVVEKLVEATRKEVGYRLLTSDEQELISMLFAIKICYDNSSMSDVEYKQEIDKVVAGIA